MKSILKRLQHNLPLFIGVVAVIAGGIGFFGIQALTGKTSDSKITAVAKSTCEVAACVDLMDGTTGLETLTVTTGSFVQFNSKDGKKYNLGIAQEKGSLKFDHADGEASHSHTEGDGHPDISGFNSGDFSGDEAWRVQFKEDGTFIFKDAYNQEISILVVVYTPGKDYTKIQ